MTNTNSKKLAIVGGGTGGHVFPGVAIAEAWIRKGGEVVFIGSERGMEADLIPKLGYPFIPIEARRLKNARFFERIANLLRMPRLIFQGFKLLKSVKADVVLGVGGYVSGPVVLAAALKRYPTGIAEQNARAGLTNRLLSKVVRRIYTAFEGMQSQFPQKKIRVLGNPVRSSIIEAAESTQPVTEGRRILILGGSQGAKAINEKLPAAISKIAFDFDGLHVIHQTGKNRDAEVQAAYDALPHPESLKVEVRPFIDHMELEMSQADLVISRAGATTVAELAVLGRPSLLIPFPYAADDHQTENARALVESGAALMEREENLDQTRLCACLTELLKNPHKLQQMGIRAQKCGHPKASEQIAEDLWQMAESK